MAWNSHLSNLRNVLAGLYWSEQEARRIVMDVGMNPIFIGFSDKPIITWQNILEQANHHNKVDAIIGKAREENPAVQALALAEEQQLHLAVQSPELPDSAWRGPREAGQLEKIIGLSSTLRPISFLEHGLAASKSVGRIVRANGERGTGFLVKGNLLVTNHHVLPSAEAAQDAVVEFNYQETANGLHAKVDAYTLSPDDGFATSPLEVDGGDDWSVVRVRGEANVQWGALHLTPATPKVKDEVIIIQHPMGGSKQIALSHNVIAYVDETRLQYLTDTLEGSSGAPVFDLEWRVVGLHQKGGWLRDPNSKQTVYRNQGIHVNVLIEGLKKAGMFQSH